MIPTATQIRRLNRYEAGARPPSCGLEDFVLDVITTRRALRKMKRNAGLILRMIVEGFEQQDIAPRIHVAPRTVSNRLNKVLPDVPRPQGEARSAEARTMSAPVSTPRMHAPREESKGKVLQQRMLHEGLSREKSAQVTGTMPTLRKITTKKRASA